MPRTTTAPTADRATEKVIDQAVKRVIITKMGRPTAIPGVTVIETYPSGQAKTYLYKNKRINRRQYFKLLSDLREQGILAPSTRSA